MSENRYEMGPAYLPAHARPNAADLQQFANPAQPVEVLRSAMPGYDAATEQTTARDRATATTIRMVLWAVTVLIAAGGLYLIGLDVTLLALGAVVLLLVGYRWLTRLDYEYSAPGVARYAIDAAERLAAEQMAQQAALRRRALDAYVAYLERRDA
mgnify:CR=1 FL=1